MNAKPENLQKCKHIVTHFELDKQNIEAQFNFLKVEGWEVCNSCGRIISDVILLQSENLSPDITKRSIEDQVIF